MATKKQPCERCGRKVPRFELTGVSDGKAYIGNVCGRCWAEVLTETSGTAVEAVEIKPIKLEDAAGKSHTFHFRHNPEPAPGSLEAFEVKKGVPAGYQFSIMAEEKEPTPRLVGRLLTKIHRGIARQHLTTSDITGGLVFAGKVVRGQIDWDESRSRTDRSPRVVIDGKAVSWKQLGDMLMNFEGHNFKLQVLDPSDDDDDE